MAWIVELTGNADNQRKAEHVYGSNYFPRRFHYKKDADNLVAKLANRGCKASVKKGK